MGIISDVDFSDKSENLTEKWLEEDIGLDAVESILAIMETHVGIDYGMPGPLVHYVEKYYNNGYEKLLIESVSRSPTKHTIWMLNRLINGTKDYDLYQSYIKVLKAVVAKAIDPNVSMLAKHFIKIQEQKNQQ